MPCCLFAIMDTSGEWTITKLTGNTLSRDLIDELIYQYARAGRFDHGRLTEHVVQRKHLLQYNGGY